MDKHILSTLQLLMNSEPFPVSQSILPSLCFSQLDPPCLPSLKPSVGKKGVAPLLAGQLNNLGRSAVSTIDNRAMSSYFSW